MNAPIVVGGLALALALGCGSPGLDVDVRPRDQRLAKRVVGFVESELRQLPSGHPVIVRYGEFKSLVAGRVFKLREHELFGNHYPATLHIDCRCTFANYATQVDIVIVEGTGPRVTFEIEPSPKSLAEHQVKYVEVEREGELWFDAINGSHSLPSTLGCRVSHPEFRP